jgi:hypothetical protein
MLGDIEKTVKNMRHFIEIAEEANETAGEGQQYIVIERPLWDIETYDRWLKYVRAIEEWLDRNVDKIDDPGVRQHLARYRQNIAGEVERIVGLVFISESMTLIPSREYIETLVLLMAVELLTRRGNVLIMRFPEFERFGEYMRWFVQQLLEDEDTVSAIAADEVSAECFL